METLAFNLRCVALLATAVAYKSRLSVFGVYRLNLLASLLDKLTSEQERFACGLDWDFSVTRRIQTLAKVELPRMVFSLRDRAGKDLLFWQGDYEVIKKRAYRV